MDTILNYYSTHQKQFRLATLGIVILLLGLIAYGNNMLGMQSVWAVQNALEKCAAEGEIIANKAKPLAPPRCCVGLKPDVYHGSIITPKVYCY